MYQVKQLSSLFVVVKNNEIVSDADLFQQNSFMCKDSAERAIEDMRKEPVTVVCDTLSHTWNVMAESGECLHYGTADSVDAWLKDNKNKYREVVK